MLLTRAPLSGPRRDLLVRLACVRPAANVRSEPGSNSPVEILVGVAPKSGARVVPAGKGKTLPFETFLSCFGVRSMSEDNETGPASYTMRFRFSFQGPSRAFATGVTRKRTLLYPERRSRFFLLPRRSSRRRAGLGASLAPKRGHVRPGWLHRGARGSHELFAERDRELALAPMVGGWALAEAAVVRRWARGGGVSAGARGQGPVAVRVGSDRAREPRGLDVCRSPVPPHSLRERRRAASAGEPRLRSWDRRSRSGFRSTARFWPVLGCEAVRARRRAHESRVEHGCRPPWRGDSSTRRSPAQRGRGRARGGGCGRTPRRETARRADPRRHGKGTPSAPERVNARRERGNAHPQPPEGAVEGDEDVAADGGVSPSAVSARAPGAGEGDRPVRDLAGAAAAHRPRDERPHTRSRGQRPPRSSPSTVGRPSPRRASSTASSRTA